MRISQKVVVTEDDFENYSYLGVTQFVGQIANLSLFLGQLGQQFGKLPQVQNQPISFNGVSPTYY